MKIVWPSCKIGHVEGHVELKPEKQLNQAPTNSVSY